MKYLIASFIIFIVGYLGLLNGPALVLQRSVTPIQLGLVDSYNYVDSTLTFFKDMKHVYNQNQDLHKEIFDLANQVIELKVAQEENLLLRDQLNVSNKEIIDRDLILANVIGNSDDLTGSTFILDKGSRHGVTLGDNLIRGNQLIGIINKVSTERSIAKKITSSEIKVTAYNIDSDSRHEGLVEGSYNQELTIKNVLQTDELYMGDTIVTSGRDGNFIPSLILGKVINVHSSPSNPLKSAQLAPIIDIHNIRKLFIVKTL